MAKRGNELNQDELFNKVRLRITAQNWYTRERVILSLIALYGVSTHSIFDPSPGAKCSQAKEDGRPQPPPSGLLDMDAKACLDWITKLFTGVDPALVTKIIRVTADWCDINVYYQPKFRDASFRQSEQSPGDTWSYQHESHPALHEGESAANAAGQNEAAPQTTEPAVREDVPSASEQIASMQHQESSVSPDSEDDALDDFFGIAVPESVISGEEFHDEPESEPEPVPAATPEPVVLNETPSGDEEDDSNPFDGLSSPNEEDDDPFAV